LYAYPSDEYGRGTLRRCNSKYGDRSDLFTTRRSVVANTGDLEQRRRSTLIRGGLGSSFMVNHGTLTFNGRDVFKDYESKPANSVFRWNLLWLVMLLFAPYPLWLTWINCRVAYEITILLNVLLTVNFMYTTVLCWRYMWRMIRCFNTPFWNELDPVAREKLQHIVVMPTYKEPVELLMETISSVANQTIASSIIMVVGMEEKTPNQEDKKRAIRERFGQNFKALIFTIHPSGVPGEIPGACSNRNFAARTAVKYMVAKKMLPIDPVNHEVDLDFATVTVCDADTTFYYRYFENLAWYVTFVVCRSNKKVP